VVSQKFNSHAVNCAKRRNFSHK